METKNLVFKENEQNLIDSLAFREPKKVPIGIEVVMWPFAYAGVTYKEVMNEPQKAAKAYMKFFDDIPIDYMWGPPGVSKSVQAFNALGNNNYVIGPVDTTIGHNQVGDVSLF